MTRLAARLAKLERGRASPGECDGMGNTYLVNDPDRFAPSRVPRCRTCGGQHAFVYDEGADTVAQTAYRYAVAILPHARTAGWRIPETRKDHRILDALRYVGIYLAACGGEPEGGMSPAGPSTATPPRGADTSGLIAAVRELGARCVPRCLTRIGRVGTVSAWPTIARKPLRPNCVRR